MNKNICSCLRVLFRKDVSKLQSRCHLRDTTAQSPDLHPAKKLWQVSKISVGIHLQSKELFLPSIKINETRLAAQVNFSKKTEIFFPADISE